MSFGSAFGKSKEGEEQLQYDDGAFSYFIFAVVLVLTFSFLYSFIKVYMRKHSARKWCLCEDCQKNRYQYIQTKENMKFNRI